MIVYYRRVIAAATAQPVIVTRFDKNVLLLIFICSLLLWDICYFITFISIAFSFAVVVLNLSNSYFRRKFLTVSDFIPNFSVNCVLPLFLSIFPCFSMKSTIDAYILNSPKTKLDYVDFLFVIGCLSFSVSFSWFRVIAHCCVCIDSPRCFGKPNSNWQFHQRLLICLSPSTEK